MDFKVDNHRVKWNFLPGEPDICRILLNETVNPGDSINLTTPFHVKIPEGVTSRLGHIGQSYQISQWYPKPAVYDNNGWHPMPYLDQGEFYSEFGKYDVSITLPANYIVGATGDLQNDREAKMLDQLASDTSWIKAKYKRKENFPPSSEQMKTLRYTGEGIHDFAFFADKRFHVLKGSVRLPGSGREVTTWLMFTEIQASLWKDALPYVDQAIAYFSKWIGDYPYNSFTVVQSALTTGAGMEYPGITVIGMTRDAYSLDEVIAHETCHSWFYAALGSNERRYPFMDEGITSAYEMRYMHERYPGKKLWEIFIKKKKAAKLLHIDKMPVERITELEWLIQARKNLEQPMNLPAPEYTMMNYSLIIYNKSAIAFNYLRAYLGDSLFDLAIHEYYRVWKFKHPQPNDLRNILETTTGKNLSWFFDDLLTTTKRLDYSIIRLKNQQLLVKNMGEMASPLVIAGISGDSTYFEKWVNGFAGEQWIDIPRGNYSEIKIDPAHVMPEMYRLNNNIRKSGIFRKADPIQTGLLYTIEDTDKQPLLFIPAVDWNRQDGFLLGMTIHNGFLLPKPMEYIFIPFYSVKNSTLDGFGKISVNIIPYEHFIRMITLSLEGSRFGAPGNQIYNKGNVGFDLYFRNPIDNSPFKQKVYGKYIVATDLFRIELLEKSKMSSYLQFGYQLEKTGFINPFTLLASFESNQSFQKASLEFNYKYSYHRKNNGLDIRLFAGKIFKNTVEIPFYDLSASGRSGYDLYLYQGTYPDRFTEFPKTFLSRQMTLSEGGLVSPVNNSLGYSLWLISLSFTSNLPGIARRVPVKPFVNLLLNDRGYSQGYISPFFYEAGLKAGIWGLFEIYIPVIVSRNMSSVTGSFSDRIRFTLNLDSIMQFKLIND